jgi:MFS transporter, MFS domain-containing protein family, molybdate-anion transporter
LLVLLLATPQMDFFVIFTVLLVICVCVQWYARQSNAAASPLALSTNQNFAAFQKNYLIVYFLVMGTEVQASVPSKLIFYSGSDWLQGPYVYKLYQYYGFGTKEIGELFIAGFLSSGVFGTFIGSFADK